MADTKNDTKPGAAAAGTKVAAAPTAAPTGQRRTVAVTGTEVGAAGAGAKAKKKVELTGDNTHIAVARGYSIVDGGGVLVEPGEFVPARTPVSLKSEDEDDPRAVAGVGWMEKVAKKDRDLMEANAQALDFKPKDVDLTQASTAALEALCLMNGIDVGGLDRDGLIAAYTAHREKDAG
jgi:hypothetical protein